MGRSDRVPVVMLVWLQASEGQLSARLLATVVYWVTMGMLAMQAAKEGQEDRSSRDAVVLSQIKV